MTTKRFYTTAEAAKIANEQLHGDYQHYAALAASAASSRDGILREIRAVCSHNNLVEYGGAPPLRICTDCGAEEVGWGEGFQVLTVEPHTVPTHTAAARSLRHTCNLGIIERARKAGRPYPVGQSHPGFAVGLRGYEELTAQ